MHFITGEIKKNRLIIIKTKKKTANQHSINDVSGLEWEKTLKTTRPARSSSQVKLNNVLIKKAIHVQRNGWEEGEEEQK